MSIELTRKFAMVALAVAVLAVPAMAEDAVAPTAQDVAPHAAPVPMAPEAAPVIPEAIQDVAPHAVPMPVAPEAVPEAIQDVAPEEVPMPTAPEAPASTQGFEEMLQAAKQPTDWLKLGGDIRLRYIVAPNLVTNDETRQFQRWRFRGSATITPTRTQDARARFTRRRITVHLRVGAPPAPRSFP